MNKLTNRTRVGVGKVANGRIKFITADGKGFSKPVVKEVKAETKVIALPVIKPVVPVRTQVRTNAIKLSRHTGHMVKITDKRLITPVKTSAVSKVVKTAKVTWKIIDAVCDFIVPVKY